MDINITDLMVNAICSVENENLLIKSAQKGDLEKVRFLCSGTPDNLILENKDLALIRSAEFGNIEVVKFLIENGADIHAQDDIALIYSASKGHLETVKYLVECGANIHTGGCNSIRCSNMDPLFGPGSHLKGFKSRALIESAQRGHLEIVKFLIENGADVQAEDNHALFCSMDSNVGNSLDVVRYLIECGADINARSGHVETKHLGLFCRIAFEDDYKEFFSEMRKSFIELI